MAIGIRLLARPPDPTWRGARCWPEGATLYLASQVTAETGTPPVSVCQAVARGLCALGPVAFLGGSGGARADRWTADGDSWVGRTRDRSGWFHWSIRMLPFMMSRNPEVVVTLFAQPGFDWGLRGQMVFVFTNGVSACGYPPAASLRQLAASFASDPPAVVPDDCIALLRPGTDGDFAEFHASRFDLVDAFRTRLVVLEPSSPSLE